MQTGETKDRNKMYTTPTPSGNIYSTCYIKYNFHFIVFSEKPIFLQSLRAWILTWALVEDVAQHPERQSERIKKPSMEASPLKEPEHYPPITNSAWRHGQMWKVITLLNLKQANLKANVSGVGLTRFSWPHPQAEILIWYSLSPFIVPLLSLQKKIFTTQILNPRSGFAQ